MFPGKGWTKADKVISIITTGCIVYTSYNYIKKDNIAVQMKITIDNNNESATVHIAELNCFNITSILHNTDCLREKGYSITRYDQDINSYKRPYTKPLQDEKLYIRRWKLIPLTRDTFINDCKECQIYTHITYNYSNIFGYPKQCIKNVYWYDIVKGELE